MTQLIIIRHGNTFGPEDTPTRVGARTDIPLSDSGILQAEKIKQYFLDHHISPDLVFASELQRTQQTAAHAFPGHEIHINAFFNEIDYGPDENKTEKEVIERIGKAAIENWDKSAIVPNGWKINPTKTIKNWESFTDQLLKSHAGKTIVIVTSNGIARFAPYITGDFNTFAAKHPIKIKTGAMCFMKYRNNQWLINDWNVRP